MHDVEVEIGIDFEQPQHLIEHLAMLSCDTDAPLDPRIVAQLQREGARSVIDSGRVPNTVRILIWGVARFV